MEKFHFNRKETAWTRKEEISGDSLFSFFFSLYLFPAWLVSTLGVAPAKGQGQANCES